MTSSRKVSGEQYPTTLMQGFAMFVTQHGTPLSSHARRKCTGNSWAAHEDLVHFSSICFSVSGHPVEIRAAGSAGRGVFAAKDFEAGEFILASTPVVAHPSVDSIGKVLARSSVLQLSTQVYCTLLLVILIPEESTHLVPCL